MTTAAEPVPDLDLLDLVLHHITEYPDTWRQDFYRCGSSYCVAGHAAVFSGYQWAFPTYSDDSYLVARPEDAADAFTVDHHVRNGEPLPAPLTIVECDDVARRLLGLTFDEADDLFAGGNTLEDLAKLREAIAARKAELDPVLVLA